MSWRQFKSQRNWFERTKHHRKSWFVLKIISCPMWQASKPSVAGSDTWCSGADAELSHMQLFFPGALAWKEWVERRVQRRQVCCESTYGCNHVDQFLGYMCPPLCVCSIYRSNLSCIASSSPDRSYLSQCTTLREQLKFMHRLIRAGRHMWQYTWHAIII